MTGDKKTEEVRFPVSAATLAKLKRVARARGYDSHSALVRAWMEEQIDREMHAAMMILGMDPSAGIARNASDSHGHVSAHRGQK